MTIQDQVIGALTAWRECRGGGVQGMQSVLNVLINRAAHRKTSIYEEAVRKWQFSSMTAPGDANLVLFPTAIDPQWAEALTLMDQASHGLLDDITGGATYYYSPAGMPGGVAPKWAATMTQTVTIAGQIFFK